MNRTVAVLVVLAACGKTDKPPALEKSPPVEKPPPLTREDCIRVRDHVAGLVVDDAIAHPEATFDGLDAKDPSRDPDLDPGLTRETFGAFLKTERGQNWIAKSKVRAVSNFEDLIDVCVQKATKANLDCWLAATNAQSFGTCSDPTRR